MYFYPSMLETSKIVGLFIVLFSSRFTDNYELRNMFINPQISECGIRTKDFSFSFT